jgi:CRISPR-associated protein Cmr6
VNESAGTDFSQAPPGHRFRLYLRVWQDGWTLDKEGKTAAVEDSLKLETAHVALLEELVDRQYALARAHGGQHARVIDGVSTAPFVTGMGNQHPLENGFTFSDPHGLPCLPGSAVKGVVRRAAEELALFGGSAAGWDLLSVWWLFGFDGTAGFFDGGHVAEPLEVERARWVEAYDQAAAATSEASARALLKAALPARDHEAGLAEPLRTLALLRTDRRLRRAMHLAGSLRFFDVLPRPGGAGNRLRVDVMTPHQGPYYQDGKPPADCHAPVPIAFLAMAPGTRFQFVVRLAPTGALPDPPRDRWGALVEEAFEHAFQWLGFGAKTALGHGAMRPDAEAEQVRQQRADARRRAVEAGRADAERARHEQELASLTGVARLVAELRQCDESRAHAIFTELQKLSGEDQRRLAEALRAAYERLDKWPGTSPKQKDKTARIRAILGHS